MAREQQTEARKLNEQEKQKNQGLSEFLKSMAEILTSPLSWRKKSNEHYDARQEYAAALNEALSSWKESSKVLTSNGNNIPSNESLFEGDNSLLAKLKLAQEKATSLKTNDDKPASLETIEHSIETLENIKEDRESTFKSKKDVNKQITGLLNDNSIKENLDKAVQVYNNDSKTINTVITAFALVLNVATVGLAYLAGKAFGKAAGYLVSEDVGITEASATSNEPIGTPSKEANVQPKGTTTISNARSTAGLRQEAKRFSKAATELHETLRR
jgi:hypothetical protein